MQLHEYDSMIRTSLETWRTAVNYVRDRICGSTNKMIDGCKGGKLGGLGGLPLPFLRDSSSGNITKNMTKSELWDVLRLEPIASRRLKA